MRRRAVAAVATQGISPVMAMLVALVIALILLLASPVKAQETTAEETTVLSADAADRKVESETDNVSVEVDNGEVSVSTDDGSSSDDGTSQQSSMTVQQNQATDGTGSRASTGDVNIGASQNSNSSCKNAHKVLSVGPTTSNVRRAFDTTGNTFRVTYDVDFTDDNDFSNFAEIDIEDNFGLVDFVNLDTDTDGKNNFVVTEGAGNYDLVVSIDPPHGARYTVTIDDCRGSNNNNNNNNDGRNRHHRHHRHHDRNRHHHRHHDRNRFHNNRFLGRGAADFQYDNSRIVEERVIKETIPKNKGRLAATGGVPLTGAAVLGLASVGLGVSILRFAIRRDP